MCSHSYHIGRKGMWGITYYFSKLPQRKDICYFYPHFVSYSKTHGTSGGQGKEILPCARKGNWKHSMADTSDYHTAIPCPGQPRGHLADAHVGWRRWATYDPLQFTREGHKELRRRLPPFWREDRFGKEN